MTDPSKTKDAADAGNDSKLPLREIAERISCRHRSAFRTDCNNSFSSLSRGSS